MPTQPSSQIELSAERLTPTAGYVWNESNRWKHLDRNLPRWAAAIWIAVIVVILARAAIQPERNTVYPIFANASRGWQQGVNIYDTSIPRGGLDRYRYAPIVAVVMTPLAMLPDALGGVLWRMINIAFYLAGVVAFVREVYPGRGKLCSADGAWLALLLLPLTIGSFNNGQANILITGCLLLGAASMACGRLNLAAAYLAVPVLFKVYPIAVVALLVLVMPRLGWRVLVAVTIGCLIPFVLQEPGFVAECYSTWFAQVAGDDRRVMPVEVAYRDFHVLLRSIGLHLSQGLYALLQLSVAGFAALLVLYGRRQGMPAVMSLRSALDLGSCWMIVFGPATENNTFMLLAPTLAFAVWDAFHIPKPSWQQLMITTALTMFVVVVLANMTPHGKAVSVALMPLGGTLVLLERFINHLSSAARWNPVAGGV